MAFSDDELDLLRHGLRLMQQRKQLAAAVIYENLFDIAPELRPLFSEDFVSQTEKVMLALGAVVGQIHDLDACRAMTRDLALRHVTYGVQTENYDQVGIAVLKALDDVLAEDMTPAMTEVWRQAYAAIAAAMIEATHEAAPQAPG